MQCTVIYIFYSIYKYIRKVFLRFYNICNYLFMLQLTCNLFKWAFKKKKKHFEFFLEAKFFLNTTVFFFNFITTPL